MGIGQSKQGHSKQGHCEQRISERVRVNISWLRSWQGSHFLASELVEDFFRWTLLKTTSQTSWERTAVSYAVTAHESAEYISKNVFKHLERISAHIFIFLR